MAAAGLNPGDRILVCLSTSWDLIELYFGAIYRGIQPILIAPPGALGGAAAHAQKLAALQDVLTPRWLICDDATRKELYEFGQSHLAASAHTCAELFGIAPTDGDASFSAKGHDLALMQLTSGSTGRQRAVMLSHAAAVHNIFALGGIPNIKRFDAAQVVSWLPLNHDMGLIGCLMFAVQYGLELTLLRPETFLARPLTWLRQFNSEGKFLSPAPNFAYQLCVDRVAQEDVASLQLGGWKSALSGAEMIRPETCRDFIEKYKPAGFDPQSLMPCYGMAEATLAVTADTRRNGIRTRPIMESISDTSESLSKTEKRDVICTGHPVLDTTLKIAAPASMKVHATDSHATIFLNENEIGEVWVKGPGIFSGYYNDPTATAEALTTDGYLRTGDLGFLYEGELYLTGRIKDLLIINGHNLMPHELEWVSDAVMGGGGTERCGAFSVSQGATGEQAVLVVEVADKTATELPTLQQEIRSRIGRSLGLPLADLMFVKRGQIPKTTSGKVQRRELRRRYMEGLLERL
jgi:fatty-acyl-CoA synthase